MQDGDKIDAFVGRKSGYYREKWANFDGKPWSIASFNLSAALVQLVWLAYRKLYVPLTLAFVFIVADVSLWLYAEDRQLISENVSDLWNWFVAVLLFLVFGFLGNYWYWRKYQEIERQAATEYADREAQLQFLRSRGGTSPVAATLVVLVFLAPVAWVLYWGVYQASRLDVSGYIFDATGPLTLAEIEANFLSRMDEPLTGDRRDCVIRELEDRARAAGDPETLDPTTVELLPADNWDALDSYGKRLILTQAITTGAFFACSRSGKTAQAANSARDEATGPTQLIVEGDRRFDVFELSNSAGDRTFASPDGTVLATFQAPDSRYCRMARFSFDYTVVLACRGDTGWEVEATSQMAPGQSTAATVFGGGDTTAISDALNALNPSRNLLGEREIIEAASTGWRQVDGAR